MQAVCQGHSMSRHGANSCWCCSASVLTSCTYLFVCVISKGLGGNDIVVGRAGDALHHLAHETGCRAHICSPAVHASCKLCQHREPLPGLQPCKQSQPAKQHVMFWDMLQPGSCLSMVPGPPMLSCGSGNASQRFLAPEYTLGFIYIRH